MNISEALRLVPPTFASAPKIWAQYTIPYTTLLASTANQVGKVTTMDDSYFLATSLTAYANNNATPPVELTAPQATYTITLASNNIQPDGNPVPVGLLITNATKRGGLELDYPLWVPPSTNLSTLVSNLTSSAFNLWITFGGVRFLTAFQKGAIQ